MSESGMRVLVVDDEPAIRRFLHVSLAAHGYVVSEAASGQAALSAVASQRPDVIVLDLGLPDVDGMDVTRILREWSQIPVIILSVRGQEEDKIAALDAGADDWQASRLAWASSWPACVPHLGTRRTRSMAPSLGTAS